MKRIYVAENPIEAKVVGDFLESAGMEVVIRGEHLFGLRGGIPLTEDTLPSVWLRYEEDYEQAQALLTRIEARAHLHSVPSAESTTESSGRQEEEDDGGDRRARERS